MRVKVSPDVAQEMITKILNGLDVVSYIDNCGILTDTIFEDHMQLVDKTLSQLIDTGMKCNPLKCDRDVEETDVLDHWMTPKDIKSTKNKVKAVLKLHRPTNNKK